MVLITHTLFVHKTAKITSSPAPVLCALQSGDHLDVHSPVIMLLFCVHCATKTPLAYNETKTEAVTILAPIRTRMGYLQKWARRETRRQKVWCLVWWQQWTMTRSTGLQPLVKEGRFYWLMKSAQQLIKCWPPTLLKSTCKIRKDAGLIGHSSAI